MFPKDIHLRQNDAGMKNDKRNQIFRYLVSRCIRI